MTCTIGILGCSGRMGRALLNAVITSPNATLSGGTVRSTSKQLGNDLGTLAGTDEIGLKATDNTDQLIETSDVIIDFTTPENTLEIAQKCAKLKTTHVIGTTGLTDSEMEQLKLHAKETVILWSANMSIGINILSIVTEKIARTLNDDFDIEIVEMHHNKKKDSPSGTALVLGEAAAKGRQVALNGVACKSRDGIIGERPKGEIGFATLRGGDVVGEHTVMFAGPDERIELTHKAGDRSIFANGAVRAAIWAKDKDAGFYTMRDMLEQ